jgi:hypothetical protein|eukprot:m.49024 g.49024  ORF g.49024 m.49024 type:complete len:93 (+) comp16023_c0_seq1:435-713(+)
MVKAPKYPIWEEDDEVSAMYDNNALKNYFPGRIVKVHSEVPIDHKSHPFAEKMVAFYYIFCCWACFPKWRSYDIKYDDGRIERRVHPSLIKQ